MSLGSKPIRKIRTARTALVVITSSLLMTMSTPSAIAGTPTFGSLDSVGVSTDGYLRLQGWAATADHPTTDLGVRALIDGSHSLLSYKVGNVYRPDVKASLGSQYSDHLGFDVNLPAPSGSHTVCMEAQNGGVYNQIGSCKTYSMPAFQGGALRRPIGGNYVVPPGTLVSRDYTINGASSAEATTIKTAASSWNNSPAWVHWNYQVSANQGSTDVYYDYYSFDGYGLTTQYFTDGTSSSGAPNVLLEKAYKYAYVQMNRDFITSDEQLQKSSAHELGHALGLFHPPSGNTSVMNQGAVGSQGVSDTPTAYDASSLDLLYPRTYNGH